MKSRCKRLSVVTGVSIGLLGVGLASCGGPPDEDVTRSGNLFYLQSKIWGQRDIPVCWSTLPTTTAEAAWVKEALRGQRSWSEAGNVNFTGWGNCAAGDKGIQLTAGAAMSTVYLSRTDSGLATMTLDFTAGAARNVTRCARNGLSREDCIKTSAIHEFGHAIGYAHEHNRSDTHDCASLPQGTDGDATFGEFDLRAIMAYCNFTTDLSPLERRGTDRIYRQAYGDSPHLGDYNGDGRDDILCHDTVSGDKWIRYADLAGHYNTSESFLDTNWCSHDTGRLLKGDFNGDGRTDLLCHDVATGEKWIDYASPFGELNGGDWYRAANWCNHAAARLFVGDFNGDGRDDLLCHDIGSGKKWIDFADSSGQFGGSDWSRAANWCSHATGRLFVGDFNGDGRDDMLCHDVADGRKWIDFADASGQFNGTDWSRSSNWCNHDTAELHIGDFNGDGRADMLCHDTATGEKWIDFADVNGKFFGTDWDGALTFCSHNAGRLFVGDANGDGRDDLVCHDVNTGEKWVDLADAAGHFNGGDWTLADGWCGHDSGEMH